MGCMKRRMLAAILAFSSSHVVADEWQVLTHSTGLEVSRTSGSLRGLPHSGKRAFYLELVRALLSELGEPMEITEVPLARGLALVQQNEGIAFFNVSRTADRESTVNWVGPISSETDRLYESAEHPTGINTLSDARHLPVCALNHNVDDAALVSQGFTAIIRSNSYSGCFKMLQAGRVLLVASSISGLQHKLAEAKVSASALRLTPVTILTSDGYIALSKSTPGSEVARWQRALDQIKQSGKYDDILSLYAD